MRCRSYVAVAVLAMLAAGCRKPNGDASAALSDPLQSKTYPADQAAYDQVRAAIKRQNAVENTPRKNDEGKPLSLRGDPGHRNSYALLHTELEGGKLPDVRGTVVLFHGYSNKPHQMSLLGQYLFQAGYNVYIPALAGHLFAPGVDAWPRTRFNPTLQANAMKRLAELTAPGGATPAQLAALAEAKGLIDQITKAQQGGVAAPGSTAPDPKELLATATRLSDAIGPITGAGGASVTLLQALGSLLHPRAAGAGLGVTFTSEHEAYIDDARARLNEIAPLPGPLYIGGLSVGGAIALRVVQDLTDPAYSGLFAKGLAEKLEAGAVVAYAPLLQVFDAQKRAVILAKGPFDTDEFSYPGGDSFKLSSFTANDVFGATVKEGPVDHFAKVRTLAVLTTNEDAADLETNEAFFKRVQDDGKGAVTFIRYTGPTAVPHAMIRPKDTEPRENRYWQRIYQETLRFIDRGQVDQAAAHSDFQGKDMPELKIDPDFWNNY
jgi:hypothetical protein